MKSRQRLRNNIRRLIDSGQVSYSAWIASGATSSGAISRILSPEGQNATLEQLDAIAYALGVEAWQLLHPDPDVATLSEQALRIAREMDSLRPEARDAAYALFVQQVEFGNARQVPDGQANGRTAPKPRALRKVHR